MIENQKVKSALSWWEYDHYLKDVDYIIIGNGIVGLSTAIELKLSNPSDKVLILDKKSVPIGASTKNAGFACFGSISEILDDYSSYGEDICRKLIEMRWKGLSILKERIHAVKMRYQPQPGAEIFSDNQEILHYKNKISWVNEFVSDIVNMNEVFESRIGHFGPEITNSFEGSLNPQMMMRELELIARNLGVRFMSGIEVVKIDFRNRSLDTNGGELNYNQLVICTNGFSRQLLPESDIQPARNQVFITSKIPNFKLNCCYHMNKGYVYFREYDGRLLIGGGRNMDPKRETTDILGTTDLISSYLLDIVKRRILPQESFSIEHRWSGILGVGKTKMPMVKKIDPNVLVAIRMGGMGVAIGSFIGKVAASMILSIDNSEHQLYVN